ncbi:hypothetical protein AU210_016347 [Fusarium oxysporum f. sp. radicis-cucumerinum]|uniref:Uncharacterized protein n=1 Tax=Fusarium oxysporum f. sp. radicis-cucumerinum TaxID=327505 RepID=A0A2H3GAJ7_FUSOX|nr:hypothetical protein AU210_016347 [Fusarium oxysporum f. sp. radicis-cucumerinum]
MSDHATTSQMLQSLHENLAIAQNGAARIRVTVAGYKNDGLARVNGMPIVSQTPRLLPASSPSMPRKRRTLSFPQNLPLCDGPKLTIFPYHKSPIQWLERLDEDDDVTSSQGYVFRVLIRGRKYAVKVVKTHLLTLLPTIPIRFTQNAEHMAGYAKLSTERFSNQMWLSPAMDSSSLNQKTRKILGKVVSMNKAGIYNMDIRIDNFRDGRLVDFGSPWTEPHALLETLSYEAAMESKLADRVMFDQMIVDEELQNSGQVKAIHPMQLRPQFL